MAGGYRLRREVALRLSYPSRDMTRTPTDFSTRARYYRSHAAECREGGDAVQAQQCEEFARRCDALAARRS